MTYEDIITALQGQISELSLKLAISQAETKAVQTELKEKIKAKEEMSNETK